MSVGENRLAGGDRQVDGGGPASFETPTAFSKIGRVQTDGGGDGRGRGPRQPGRRMIDVKLYAHW